MRWRIRKHGLPLSPEHLLERLKAIQHHRVRLATDDGAFGPQLLGLIAGASALLAFAFGREMVEWLVVRVTSVRPMTYRRYLSWKSAGFLLVGLVTVQVVLWLTVGIRSLPRCVPTLIAYDVQETVGYYEAQGKVPPTRESAHYWVLCDSLAEKLDTSQLRDLNALLAPLRLSVVTPSEAPQLPEAASPLFPDREDICYRVNWNIPLVASVEYGRLDCPLCAWGVGHRVWFVFGFWVPEGAYTQWVS